MKSFNFSIFQSFNRNSGFTVIEMIVALFVFSMIIAIVTGTFISSMQNQKLAIAMVEVQDAVSLALEEMAREIRMGIMFNSSGIIGNYNYLSFYDVNGDYVKYEYSSSTQLIKKCLKTETNCKQITPSNIMIEDFRIVPNSSGNLFIINFLAFSKEKKIEGMKYRVQTSVSARSL